MLLRRRIGQSVKGDGAGHEHVVVITGLGGIRTVGQLIVDGKLVAGIGTALDIVALADGLDKAADDGRLGGAIGVKAYAETGIGGFAAIDVGIDVGDAFEDKAAEGGEHTRLEGVALDDEQGFVVAAGDDDGNDAEEVVVDVSAPLGDNLMGNALGEVATAHDGDDRPVARETAASDVDGHDIVGSGVGLTPDLEFSAGRVDETSGDNVALAHRLEACGMKPVDVGRVENAVVGRSESLRVVGGELGNHLTGLARLAGLFAPPENLLEGATEIPKAHVLVGQSGRKLLWRHFEVGRIALYLIPCDEDRALVAFAGLGPLPLLVEEIADAVGGRLDDDERVRDVGHGDGDVSDNVVGRMLGGVGPIGGLREVGHGEVVATERILILGRGNGHAARAASDLADVGRAFEGLESQAGLGFVAGVEQIEGIKLDELGVHVADVLGAVLVLTADDRVPVGSDAHLNPGHERLNEC